MKLVLALLLFASPLVAAPHDEVLVVEELIATTEKNLKAQEELLKQLHNYHSARDAFIADPESSKRATALVKRAMRLQTHIEQEHLSQLFSSDFLTELSFYNQVGKGRG